MGEKERKRKKISVVWLTSKLTAVTGPRQSQEPGTSSRSPLLAPGRWGWEQAPGPYSFAFPSSLAWSWIRSGQPELNVHEMLALQWQLNLLLHNAGLDSLFLN